jgi:hypothetical protein
MRVRAAGQRRKGKIQKRDYALCHSRFRWNSPKMSGMLTAIETTGTLEPDGRIVIDETFAVNAPTPVRVIVLFPENDDISENEWAQAAAKNEAFAFLHEPGEDIYTLADGKPLNP